MALLPVNVFIVELLSPFSGALFIQHLYRRPGAVVAGAAAGVRQRTCFRSAKVSKSMDSNIRCQYMCPIHLATSCWNVFGIQQLEAWRHSCNKTHQGFPIVRASANLKLKFGLQNDRKATGNVEDVNSVAMHFGACLDVLGDLWSSFVPIAENYKIKGSEKCW